MVNEWIVTLLTLSTKCKIRIHFFMTVFCGILLNSFNGLIKDQLSNLIKVLEFMKLMLEWPKNLEESVLIEILLIII